MNFEPSQLRKHILTMAHRGQTVHIPCAFSWVEVASTLFGGEMRFDPRDPRSPTRDYLVLSKGHGVMTLYACFKELGWITAEELDRYTQDGTHLPGLAESSVVGIETCSGSLGHGLPVAAGMAWGLKQRGSSQRVFCLVGDGEMNEGPMWEACLFAAHHGLDNLVVIVDANGHQAMGRIEDVLDLEPFVQKFTSFGFDSVECDGHDLSALRAAFQGFRTQRKPHALVARTTKGKGVSFMEDNNVWHYTRINSEQLQTALQELK